MQHKEDGQMAAQSEGMRGDLSKNLKHSVEMLL